MKKNYVLKAVSGGALAAALVLAPTVVTSSNVALAAYNTTTTTSTTATSNTSLSQYGGQPTVTAQVLPTAGKATPTGTVTFHVTNGSGAALHADTTVTLPSSGAVTYTFPVTAPANQTYSVKATYNGDTDSLPSSGTTNVTIYERPTTTTINSSTATGNKNGRKIQATVTVSSSGNIGTPTGSVTLRCIPVAGGSSAVASAAALDSSGTTTATCNSVEGTSYRIAAVYSGDANKYVASTSAEKTQTG